ncbi:MAG: hypothetical protein J1F12_08275 [Muribaculaceae bacterium]|nr:hypothetical protein [Muribaculaceae bacterium]
MKKKISLLVFLFVAIFNCMAQDYNLEFAGVGDGGNYFVKVTAILSKKEYKASQDWLKRLAVDGVMFRGVGGGAGYNAQKALINDPAVRDTKAEFFTLFNKEKKYLDFCNLKSSSVVATKLPKGKYEVSGNVLVDKEKLLQYLMDNGIVSGMNNLW